MKNLAYRWVSNSKYFSDIDAVGIFVDNHDNPRFLHGNDNIRLYKSALTFVLCARGIPFFYYGSEQAFAGGVDPDNREVLWSNFDRTSDMFKFTQTVNRAIHSQNIQNNIFAEKWAD